MHLCMADSIDGVFYFPDVGQVCNIWANDGAFDMNELDDGLTGLTVNDLA